MVKGILHTGILLSTMKPLTTRTLVRTLSIDTAVEMGSIQAEIVPWKI